MESIDELQRKHYYDLFKDEVEHLSQQKTSKFLPHVEVETGLTGELVRTKKQYGKTSTNKNRRGRGLDTPQNDTDRTSVWYGNNMYDWGDLLETDDEVRQLGTAQNAVIRSAEMAFGRDIDDEVLDAFFGPVKLCRQPENTEKNT